MLLEDVCANHFKSPLAFSVLFKYLLKRHELFPDFHKIILNMLVCTFPSFFGDYNYASSKCILHTFLATFFSILLIFPIVHFIFSIVLFPPLHSLLGFLHVCSPKCCFYFLHFFGLLLFFPRSFASSHTISWNANISVLRLHFFLKDFF